MKGKAMKNKIASSLAASALGASALLGGAAPAAASPVASTTAVAPVLGMYAGAYQLWCNGFGTGCKYAKRWNRAGGYYYNDICSNVYCTEFVNVKKHPPISKAKWSGIYRNY